MLCPGFCVLCCVCVLFSIFSSLCCVLCVVCCVLCVCEFCVVCCVVRGVYCVLVVSFCSCYRKNNMIIDVLQLSHPQKSQIKCQIIQKNHNDPDETLCPIYTSSESMISALEIKKDRFSLSNCIQHVTSIYLMKYLFQVIHNVINN